MRRVVQDISIILLVGCGLTTAGSAGASAAETYFCADGRTLVVDQSNRERLAADPCIKEWFARNARPAKSIEKPATNPADKPAETPVEKAADKPAAKAPVLGRAEQPTVHVRKYTKARRTVIGTDQR